MTKVFGATVTLKEGQIWKLKIGLRIDEDVPTEMVRILAIGKTHMALQDINCDSHFITKVIDNNTFSISYAQVLIKQEQE